MQITNTIKQKLLIIAEQRLKDGKDIIIPKQDIKEYSLFLEELAKIDDTSIIQELQNLGE